MAQDTVGDPNFDRLKEALNRLCGEANEAASIVRRLYDGDEQRAKLRLLAKVMEMVDDEFPDLLC